MQISTNKEIYITTTLPYVNSVPHIGHALEFIQADVLKRTIEKQGKKVFLNIGLDEHGTKIYKTAKDKNMDVKTYVDAIAKHFVKLLKDLNIEPSRFIRTTDPDHKEAVFQMWNRCLKNGDIYKKEHSGHYCVGCELFKIDEDLTDNKCPLHPNLELEFINEENYFFRFSKYQDFLLDLYKKENFLIPQEKLRELNNFVNSGLKDFSISRKKERLPWGIGVPGDDEQVIYVWFDALTNYLTTIGWPNDKGWADRWPVIQLAGKDNIRQQAAIFQAMLKSANVSPSKTIFIHGFLTSDGKKMSKSLGNVINPNDILEKYGTDFLRLFLIKHINPFEDTDITNSIIDNAYNSDLVNGIGNLVSRILTLSEKYLDSKLVLDTQLDEEFIKHIEGFDFKRAGEYVYSLINELDKEIARKEPYKTVKTDLQKGCDEIKDLVIKLHKIAVNIYPIMPETSKTILMLIKENKKPSEPLFQRYE